MAKEDVVLYIHNAVLLNHKKRIQSCRLQQYDGPCGCYAKEISHTEKSTYLMISPVRGS